MLIFAALDGWRRQMVEHGHAIYDRALALAHHVRAAVNDIDGFHVYGRAEYDSLTSDMDPLQVIIDISATGASGYVMADWLREHHQINMHLSDHRRISAQLSHADDEKSAEALLAALRDLATHAADMPAAEVRVPGDLRLEQVIPPRDAFFGEIEQVSVDEAAGRISAEMLTPYPPGIPAALPGERLTGDVLTYLTTGLRSGMVIPDAWDSSLKTIHVVKD
ncbi:Orn/Lys/Arg family decarboxylase [Herbidospora solisilvae]|uniref:Orn/Lys/Arg family decarboxylase n=1 Tax=Herbidospora solisilvae TaxID=2696284 RepID=UPI002E2A6071|nr:hypothetical protein [Herbidospora solisilvae]